MIGQIISHFRILDELGGDGTAVVRQTEDTLLDRAFSLKLLPPDLIPNSDTTADFILKARIVKRLWESCN
jgi:hypothetical protein